MTKSKHEYLKHYYAAHRDILKARMRQYYIKNKEKISEKRKNITKTIKIKLKNIKRNID